MLFSLNPHHNSLGDTVVYCGDNMNGIMQTTVENISIVHFSVRFLVIITPILSKSKTGLVTGD